ncbi:hypothetical protein DDV96_00950 [Marixanthomonas spongiae]|uniref:Uncharacterized protein n=1 Tax=Marixanthomonas spongiae TaxID=2174845 RepID=A0A2U0I7P0_9FLAO|nr:hypothetical protein DDV96_00950 [Marixanthomonas spongiae]
MFPVVLIVAFLLLLVGMLLLFCFRNRTSQKLQALKVNRIKKQIAIHQKQIKVRNSYLNTYDFLEYNLNDSLFTQKNINLNL